jgi:hypothetical protein
MTITLDTFTLIGLGMIGLGVYMMPDRTFKAVMAILLLVWGMQIVF